MHPGGSERLETAATETRAATLARERDFVTTVLETADALICVVDGEGRIVRFNRACEETTGYAFAEVEGRPFWDLFLLPHEKGAVRETVATASADRFPNRHENHWLTRSGERRLIAWHNSALLDDDGVVEFVVGVGIDITEQRLAEHEAKRAEEELRAAEHRYRALVETLPLITYIDQPNASASSIYISPQVEQILGYAPEEWLADPALFPKLVHPEDRERVLAELRTASNGKPDTTEYRLVARDGRVVAFRDESITFHDESGQALYTQGFMLDVTEQKQLEAQLHQAQRMEAVGQLAGGIAHDFNNLLTAIMGYSDLLIVRMDENDKLRGEVDEIRRAADRAASLTRQLLAYSRKQVLRPTVLDLNALVTNVEKMLRRLIGEDIELVVRLVPGLGRIMADPGQIEQVIVNLALNSRDAMTDGGKLVIETSNAELEEGASSRWKVEPGRYVLLSVADTGRGMDAETQNRAFEPFFTTKERGRGTGLGLSTVYGIVKQSGGHVWLTSEPGQGSSVKVYLPQVDTEVEPVGRVEVRRADTEAQGLETILLVEDESAVRSVTAEALGAGGYHVLEARDGLDALEVAKKYPGEIDLLLTDVVMPRMGGPELSARLASLRPRAKVIYMSGYSEEIAQRSDIGQQGDFLQKPFAVTALAVRVREVLDRR